MFNFIWSLLRTKTVPILVRDVPWNGRALSTSHLGATVRSVIVPTNLSSLQTSQMSFNAPMTPPNVFTWPPAGMPSEVCSAKAPKKGPQKGPPKRPPSPGPMKDHEPSPAGTPAKKPHSVPSKDGKSHKPKKGGDKKGGNKK
ncbi:hypothetical protein BV898_02545 [Hypsibius exemplaris]|uniref:Uncharacterized protein n=1 Tax=Hypsibius exemplaris TaxID=2072580 RepID=A0A1W0X7E8_HYPEX|nr:hypothetical protein BV898_02545 [Hypsibius exemplaris]